MKMRMSRLQTTDGVAADAAGLAGFPAVLRAPLDAAAATIALWRARHHDRRAIRQLDDHMLRDIGLDPIAAHEIAARPFWKA